MDITKEDALKRLLVIMARQVRDGIAHLSLTKELQYLLDLDADNRYHHPMLQQHLADGLVARCGYKYWPMILFDVVNEHPFVDATDLSDNAIAAFDELVAKARFIRIGMRYYDATTTQLVFKKS